jgi:hypothetical protein
MTESAIRHAIVALGAMDKKMETLDEFKSLSLDEQEKSSHLHHLNALKEYSTAISKMRVSSNSRALSPLPRCILNNTND